MLRSLAIWMTSLFLCRLDNLLSLFVSTTEELQRPLHRLLFCLILFPIHLTIVIFLAPIGLVGLTLWIIFSNNTKTCIFSYAKTHPNNGNYNTFTGMGLNIATINTCLHSDFISRLNNISRSSFRARRIGDILSGMNRSSGNYSLHEEINYDDVRSPSSIKRTLYFKSSMNFIEIPVNFLSQEIRTDADVKMPSAARSHDCYRMMSHDILCQFPQLDFLLLQEVFSVTAANILVKSLHKRFPYIIFDPRQDGYASNRWSLGSGLLIASRFPVTHVNFDMFKHKGGYAAVSSLGVLQAKIDLGRNSKGRQQVGYLTNTHLQPYKGDSSVHWAQLLQIRAACATMRTLTSSQNDVILFDIVGGDFNLDNMSPADQVERTHPIFEEYIDVCREGPGVDKPWTVGSTMRHPPLHDRLIHTPEGLCYAILTPELRTRYILDADVMKATINLTKQMPPVDKVGEVYVTAKSGKRRIDYLLFNRDYPLVVTSFNAVTELAGLTDHISFSMTFSSSSQSS